MARKKGGWKKRAELGKVGVDEFLYISVAMRELLVRHPWLRALLQEISLNQVKVAPTVHTVLSEMWKSSRRSTCGCARSSSNSRNIT
ncbi:hypothetical protein TrLO_g6720 [Triparma laevis f. longispina]|uniref:Uncharacterized protein n=1 Tax=Triparma laevis f. longispina TaxID=1714387 RepID=A0A9W7KXG2_9STRA|nr:hypothetical protein TrLO_g6720 [Triparma laevis f. longispina]